MATEAEEQLKRYREKYMGGLPEQLNTNLRILERLQDQFIQLSSNLRDAENRKLIIQKEIASAEKGKSRESLFITNGQFLSQFNILARNIYYFKTETKRVCHTIIELHKELLSSEEFKIIF